MGVIDLISDLPVNSSKKYSTRNVKDVDMIVVHQTDADDRGLASVYATAKYHVNSNNWPGVGYHYIITDDGKSYQVNDLSTISYHAKGYNSRSVGISITGKHRYDDALTNEEIIGEKKYSALVSTIVKVLRKLPNKNIDIVSHASVNNTGKTDPNLNMYQLKKDVKKKSTEQDNSDSGNSSNIADELLVIKDEVKGHIVNIIDELERIKKLL